MSFAGTYLEKVSIDPLIDRQDPDPDLFIVIAIPACNEPDLLKTLNTLNSCRGNRSGVEIIIALNSGESAPSEVINQNLLTEQEINGFIRENSRNGFRILYTRNYKIPKKDAGAGTARKIAMDHALSRFNRLEKPEGIILSLDADTICEPGYLSSVEEHFMQNKKSKACSVYFEHPLEGNEFPAEVYSGICQYELHLRYYVEGMRYSGHPHAYHTVGSAFGVRAGAYARQGGMNRRTAGEDFYFLQKIIPLGDFTELNNTCLQPSPRPSDRVAFGTGPVISRFLSGEVKTLESYNPEVFNDLKNFFSDIPQLYSAGTEELRAIYNSWPDPVKKFLGKEFFNRLSEISENSASQKAFYKRFYRWFNMFQSLKYINYAHREYYARLPVSVACREFLLSSGSILNGDKNGLEGKNLLLHLRNIQREGNWINPWSQ